ncbi:pyruvate dehydrogenase (acetyl-transferring) E1 component subunit alpha [Halovenus sp. WSH3]|uniref:Pyruvate dehydrogenase (Acetyl-transferring) E1 component subunit alpha n=1 Tax=Halovenus carboxidivorans TaxID=2692199 RepID=A0A6B0T3D1_9EURY|nr:pyruvate dehydrogenase (acetyl-transferring) E1 component subunit alpha [Halovenus carboxidivorans]MXR52574.1 pyruvate dehydrogenase (acetyl-transferring) E1 component subunit alpha [Halovenus carboxidivorans]
MTTTGSLPGEPDLVQVLDENGSVLDGATVPDLSEEALVEMYEQMVFARHLDERAVTLHRQGRIGTYPPLAGQEAAQVASTHALADDDWISYQYREHGAVGVRGMSYKYLLYWMGYEEGNGHLADEYIFPMNISIGSQLPHATGMAWASKLNGDDNVVMCHFGDGATSEGDFHEGLNFAGVYNVPAIFFCNNNQYAISVGRENQTASATIAQKAEAYGFEGMRVDGMDPLAVYAVTEAAVEKARDPDAEPPEGVGRAGRPSLIEAVMYRLGAHTTVDDPDAYREQAEVERWRAFDPIERYESFLRDRGLLDDESVDEIHSTVEDEVAAMIDEAEQADPDPMAMFERPYETPTPRVQEQKEYLADLRERHGDDALTRDE